MDSASRARSRRHREPDSQREKLIEEWLAEQLGIDIEKAKIVVMEADRYADFLSRELDIKDPAVTLRVDPALQAWRQRQQK